MNKLEDLSKTISECLTITKVMKNSYKAAIVDKEKVTPEDLCAIWDLIIEMQEKALKLANELVKSTLKNF